MARTAVSCARTTALWLVLLAPGAEAGAKGEAADEEPKTGLVADLAGRWVYNAQLSDDAQEKMREGVSKREPGGGGGMRGPGARVGGRGGSSGPPGGDDDPREAWRAILEPAEELLIAQSEAEIAVDEKFGRTRRLHPDGKKYKTDNGTSEIKSYWKEGRLVVETKRAHGSSIETWERVPDGSRLIVTARLEGGVGPKLELKRIYDLALPAAESPAK